MLSHSFRFGRRSSGPPQDEEDVDDDARRQDEALDKLEAGESLLKNPGGSKTKSKSFCSKHIERCVESCTDATAWRSIERLLFAFRFTQYLDILVSIISFLTTVSLASSHDIRDVQLPVVAISLALMALVVPWIGVFASFRLARKTILFVTVFAACYKLGFTSLQLVYLYRAVGQDGQDEFLAETVLSAFRLALGIAIVFFGHACYRKLTQLVKGKVKVLVVGLDGAGKSLIVDNLLPQQVRRNGSTEWAINPTAGLAFHEFLQFDTIWRMWDTSGNGRARSLWAYYYSSMDAIVFVVDSSDLKRLGSVREEFKLLLAHPDVRAQRPSILILLNKMDLPETSSNGRMKRLSPDQLRQLLGIDSTVATKFKVRVQPCSALQGQGIQEGFQWLTQNKAHSDE